jgi:hypothetical protein
VVEGIITAVPATVRTILQREEGMGVTMATEEEGQLVLLQALPVMVGLRRVRVRPAPVEGTHPPVEEGGGMGHGLIEMTTGGILCLLRKTKLALPPPLPGVIIGQPVQVWGEEAVLGGAMIGRGLPS